mgnify:CR=1 FL=1
MPGAGRRFTAKQDRMAKHIMKSEMKRGVPKAEAERIGYATVNKMKRRKKG